VKNILERLQAEGFTRFAFVNDSAANESASASDLEFRDLS
jgi:hypothetical protein